MGSDIGLLPVLLGVTFQNRNAQRLDAVGNLDVVAVGLHPR
jgi:hypothetical protein